MNPIDPALAEFFADNRSMQRLIVSKLKIQWLAELLMHTPRSIYSASGLGISTETYLRHRIEQLGLKRRENDENVLDYLNRVYGSLDKSPVVVLNFTVSAQNLAFYKPVHVVQLIAEQYPELTIGELKRNPDELLELASAPPTLDELSAFGRRCHEWGFQRAA